MATRPRVLWQRQHEEFAFLGAVNDDNPVYRGIIGVFRNAIVPFVTCEQFSFRCSGPS